MADVVVRCFDRWGREIVLTDRCWHDHILIQHPDLTGYESAVRLALTDPMFVNQDARYPNRENYYCVSPLPPNFSGVYVKVVVEFEQRGVPPSEMGEVVTA